ncbi:MAG: hypothetical protein JJT95_17490 [Pararhodobacter sp.]|nr:hypothetical protein [Pararhodobacter sp.]
MNAEVWDFLGREVAPHAFREVATALIVFLTVGHFIHWRSDYLAYTRWFKSASGTKADIYSIGRMDAKIPLNEVLINRVRSIEEKDEEALTLIENIEKSLSSVADVLSQENQKRKTWVGDTNNKIIGLKKEIEKANSLIVNLLRDLGEMKNIMSEMDVGFKKVNFAKKVEVYVWYLAIPLLVSFLSMYSLWLPFPVRQ